MNRELDGAVLVTGGSGFIGSAVIQELASTGVAIRLLAPPNEKNFLYPDHSEIIIGDIRDRERVRKALADVKYLFHIAGDYRLWAQDPDEIYSVNVTGTKIIMEEAIAANLSCVIHTSSASTIKQDPKYPADETAIAQEDDVDGPYSKSKVIADTIVRKLTFESSLPAIIIKPTTVIGPRDTRPTPTGQLVLNAVKGKVPAFVDTKLNICHVEDVARGYLLAFKHGTIGRDYILGGDNVTLQEFLFQVATEIGNHPPKWKLPSTPLLPLAYANELFCRISGATPFLTLAGLKHARKGLVYKTGRAREELGYTSRPFPETVKSAVNFFMERNRNLF